VDPPGIRHASRAAYEEAQHPMTTPHARARRAAPVAAGRRTTRAAAVAALALAAACSDMATDPKADAGLARSPAAPSTAFTEEFDGASFPAWTMDTHPLGRGSVRAENVTLGGGTAALALAAGAYDGAEVYTAARYGTGAYEARMRTPHAPGSVSAFFLYQGVPEGNDEIDIELFNDGTRRIMFTTWVAGKETNNVIQTLPFDPAAALHDYRIEWSVKVVRFRVDGVVMQEFRRGIPKNAMFVMANTWWPAWLTGPLLAEPRTFVIDRIRVGG
jgi:endo-1,3-1,4-beta-glycanase ExoK